MRSTIVASATVGYIWPLVEKYVKSGFEWGRGDETYEDVVAQINAGDAQLWVLHHNAEVRGAGVTRVVTMRTGRKICACIAYGGADLADCKYILKDVERFAKRNGCTAVRITGRRGWAVLKECGYKEPFMCLEKEL